MWATEAYFEKLDNVMTIDIQPEIWLKQEPSFHTDLTSRSQLSLLTYSLRIIFSRDMSLSVIREVISSIDLDVLEVPAVLSSSAVHSSTVINQIKL